MKKNDEINTLNEDIYHSLRSYKLITYPLALIIALIFYALSLILLGSSLWGYLGFLIMPSSLFIGFIISDYVLNTYFRIKVIKKLGLDKHKYFNEIRKCPDIKDKRILMGVICIIIGVLAWYGGRAL